MGTGPWKMSTWKRNGSMRFERYESYWGSPLSQNLLPAWTFAPQLEQTAPNGAPHSRQNRAPSQFFAWHRGHSMRLAPLPRYVRSVAEE